MSLSILCPVCHAGTRVKDSRPIRKMNAITRRRRCEACDYRFTTYERVVLGAPHGNSTYQGAANHIRRALTSLEGLAKEAGELDDNYP